MRRFKYLNLLIIFLLVLSLGLTGCRKKSKEGEKAPVDETTVEVMDEEDDGGILEEDAQKDIDDVDEDDDDKEEKDVQEDIDDEDDASSGAGVSGQAKGEGEEEEATAKEEEQAAKEEPAAVDPNALKIEGKVSNPLAFSLKELKGMGDLIFEGDYYSINNFGTKQHTRFKGVKLWGLLEKAQVASDATKVRIVATDGYEMEFTIDEVKKQDYIDETNPSVKLPIIIAWEENGVEFDSDDGPPFKLIVGQKEPGDVNKPKWVSNIDKVIVE
ncbi:MAG: molybdopterin-dependent oxidoreductase [Tissierellia bacterium]|nr:molybdopterin-dependent oxidoreductase [Tissierellia bacterium]